MLGLIRKMQSFEIILRGIRSERNFYLEINERQIPDLLYSMHKMVNLLPPEFRKSVILGSMDQ